MVVITDGLKTIVSFMTDSDLVNQTVFDLMLKAIQGLSIGPIKT